MEKGSSQSQPVLTPKSAIGTAEPSAAQATSCAKCGETGFSTSYTDCAEKRRMDRDGLCFGCAFWSVKADAPPHKRTVIAGRSYGPGDRTTGSFRGMGGRRFDIEYVDGRRITTYDLWSGGQVPDIWRDQFPDNARFLGSAEAVRVGDVTCWNPSDPSAPAYPLPKDNPPKITKSSEEQPIGAESIDAVTHPGMINKTSPQPSQQRGEDQ